MGGRYSNVREDWANICWRALLTSIKGQVTEYKETTKFSMTSISSEESVTDLSTRRHNVAVRSGLVAHLRCADFFFSSSARTKGGIVAPCQGMKCREGTRRHAAANVVD